MAKSTKEEATPSRRRAAGAHVANARAQLARIVGIIFVVLAVILALAALLVALKSNISHDNPLVKFVLNVANAIDGPFSKDNGIFHFHGKSANVKNALVNWGIAAVIYLIIGRVLATLIRPKGTTKG